MNYKDINDYELVYLIQESSDTEDEFKLLLMKYRPVILNKINKYRNLLQKYKIEYSDLIQKINYEIYKNVKNFDESKNCTLYTYLDLSIDMIILDYIKCLQTQKRRAISESISFDAIVYGNLTLSETLKLDYNLEEEFEVSLLEDRIKDFCYSLPFENSIIFELSFSGYKVAEIAKLVDMDSRRISEILVRIRRKFKKNLKSFDYL